jgi:hypothetical protein
MTVAEEAQLYLAAVEVFRAEGCEPHWRPEPPIVPRKREKRLGPQAIHPVRRNGEIS